MRDLETSIVQNATELLNSHTEQLAACGLTWQGPEIEVWQTESDCYTSEVRINILKGGEIHDVLEFHVFRNGQPLVTEEEAINWLREQLAQLQGQRR